MVGVALFGRGRGVTEEERARLAPGQHLVRDFPVLHAGSIPYREVPADWDFRIWGRVDRPLRWTYEELRSQDITRQVCDIHCVTTWTKLDTVWEGVALAPLLAEPGAPGGREPRRGPQRGGLHRQHPARDGAARRRAPGLPLRRPELEPEHGGPLRLLVPSLYFWKSAKWLRGLEVLDHDEPGFWERLGYSELRGPLEGGALRVLRGRAAARRLGPDRAADAARRADRPGVPPGLDRAPRRAAVRHRARPAGVPVARDAPRRGRRGGVRAAPGAARGPPRGRTARRRAGP